MRTIAVLTMILSFFISGCASLKPPITTNNGDAKKYKYVYISPTNSLTSSSGTTISGQYFSSTKTVNPSDIIAGILAKEGFIKLPELKSDLTGETLIVNYGESGRR